MKRKDFTKDFKLEAVRLLENSGRPAAAVARELGIRRNQLYKLHYELRNKSERAFPGRGPHPKMADELIAPEKRAAQVERDILEKAMAFFAESRMRFAFVEQRRQEFPVAWMCRLLR